MKNRIVVWSALGVLAILVMGSAFGWAEEDQGKEAQALLSAKVSLSQAIDKVLQAVPGKALSAELDGDQSPAAYVVEVLDQGKTYEVTLNSQNGQVVSKKLDRKDDDDHDGDKEDRD